MDPNRFTRVDATTWRVEPHGKMLVPAIIYADEDLIRGMDDKVYEQATNVATLPGIVQASYAMPDAHWGYGFPIGGVASFDPDQGGVVSAGGVGFDISCGVRTMLTGLSVADILPVQKALADTLFGQIPAGFGSKGAITLDAMDMDAMLTGGACWAVGHGWGEIRDLERIEEEGRMAGAKPGCVSERAKERQRREIGPLGSGNYYLEVQAVAEIFDSAVAKVFGLAQGDVVVTIHCGSRGLGHQIGTEFLKEMAVAAKASGRRGGGRGKGFLISMPRCWPRSPAMPRSSNGAGTKLSMTLRCKEFWSALHLRAVFAEEAPGAYKDVDAVVASAEHAELARRVARLRPADLHQGIGRPDGVEMPHSSRSGREVNAT